MDRYIQVTTTTETEEEAEIIARALVDLRLAACVQIVGPITSVYRWQGEVKKTGEFLVYAKSRQDLFPDIEEFFKENHPYEVPELIAIPLAMVGSSYAAWLEAELR